MNDELELFSHAAPILAVDNAVETATYYKDKLGFTIEFLYGDPPYFAIVSRDDAVSIHLSEREDTSTKIPPSSVYIFVDDVDAVYAEYKAKGLKIFAAPEDQDYGMREFELSDLNGHFLIFGQALAVEAEFEPEE
jgi:uncharacterized glyoxalase superfamily protein PhnB